MYVRKTIDEYEIQSCFEGTRECEVTESTYKEAREQLKCYRENSPYPSKLIKKRIKKEEVDQ
jgi:hypothetical protein